MVGAEIPAFAGMTQAAGTAKDGETPINTRQRSLSSACPELVEGSKPVATGRFSLASTSSTVDNQCLPGAEALTVAGLTSLSTCDWPGKLVATVFLQGCPWRCTYCHNPALLDPLAPGEVPWRQVRDLLDRRRGLLDGLVFSGGEPTRQAALPSAMREVRTLGFGVGLHTAGAYPSRLSELLGLVDWVGLDIKALPADYHRITGVGASGTRAFASLDLLVASGVDHEVRITVDPTVHTAGQIERLVEVVRSSGARRMVLQEARPQGTRPEYAARLAGRRLGDILASPPAKVGIRCAG